MMYMKDGTTLETQYKDILQHCLAIGMKRKTRKFNCIELSPFAFTTDHPLRNVLTNPLRNINRAFSIIEFLWILSGRNDVEMLKPYNSKLSEFSDNGVTYKGAYGPSFLEQINYLRNCFFKDRFSRQAISTIWKRNPSISKDIPCTIMFHFQINNFNQMDMIVYMRSNDLWLGFPYDFYNFTMIQNYMSFLTCTEMGRYTHLCGNSHLYENNIEQAKLASSFVTKIKDIKETELIKKDQLKETLEIEQQIRSYYATGTLTEMSSLIDFTDGLEDPWKEMIKILTDYLIKKECTRVSNML